MEYGTSALEQYQAKQTQQKLKPSLEGPTKDGYLGTPTFVVDANRKKMTVIWAELPKDIELRKRAKEEGLPVMPPPPATDARHRRISKRIAQSALRLMIYDGIY